MSQNKPQMFSCAYDIEGVLFFVQPYHRVLADTPEEAMQVALAELRGRWAGRRVEVFSAVLIPVSPPTGTPPTPHHATPC